MASRDQFILPSARALREFHRTHGGELPEKARAFARLSRDLNEHWHSLLIGAGIVAFACEGLRRFGLDETASEEALELLQLAVEEEREADKHLATGQLVCEDVSSLLITACKSHPSSPRVNGSVLGIIGGLHIRGQDEAICAFLSTVCREGVVRTATVATREFGWGETGARIILVRVIVLSTGGSAHFRCSCRGNLIEYSLVSACRCVANVCSLESNHNTVILADGLLWACSLLCGEKAESSEAQAALCFCVSQLTAKRENAHAALANGRIFHALAGALQRFPEHAGLVQHAAAATSHLLCDHISRREFTVETGLCLHLCHAFQLHSQNPRVALAVLRALAAICNTPGVGASTAARSGAAGVVVTAILSSYPTSASGAVHLAALDAASKMCLNAPAGSCELLAAGVAEAAIAAGKAHESAQCQVAVAVLFSELLCKPAEMSDDERPSTETLNAGRAALTEWAPRMVAAANASLAKYPHNLDVEQAVHSVVKMAERFFSSPAAELTDTIRIPRATTSPKGGGLASPKPPASNPPPSHGSAAAFPRRGGAPSAPSGAAVAQRPDVSAPNGGGFMAVVHRRRTCTGAAAAAAAASACAAAGPSPPPAAAAGSGGSSRAFARGRSCLAPAAPQASTWDGPRLTAAAAPAGGGGGDGNGNKNKGGSAELSRQPSRARSATFSVHWDLDDDDEDDGDGSGACNADRPEPAGSGTAEAGRPCSVVFVTISDSARGGPATAAAAPGSCPGTPPPRGEGRTAAKRCLSSSSEGFAAVEWVDTEGGSLTGRPGTAGGAVSSSARVSIWEPPPKAGSESRSGRRPATAPVRPQGQTTLEGPPPPAAAPLVAGAGSGGGVLSPPPLRVKALRPDTLQVNSASPASPTAQSAPSPTADPKRSANRRATFLEFLRLSSPQLSGPQQSYHIAGAAQPRAATAASARSLRTGGRDAAPSLQRASSGAHSAPIPAAGKGARNPPAAPTPSSRSIGEPGGNTACSAPPCRRGEGSSPASPGGPRSPSVLSQALHFGRAISTSGSSSDLRPVVTDAADDAAAAGRVSTASRASEEPPRRVSAQRVSVDSI